ncbi:MAG: enoyl-CoA hydratase/isomerase family protein [Deltaproteobacteria bacterium]|nr:MAG: enoyl-CoA hydratase/isomerase family protein [Deltaproteobacteria bacterium]
MAYENILFEVEAGIATLTFNRPKVLNALTFETIKELAAAIRSVEENEDVRVLILTGAGDRAFVAGADIKELQEMSPLFAKHFAAEGQKALFGLENLAIPVIACVNGFALGGGCEIALACDFIYASESAKLGQPEINLGIIPGFGGTQRLLRLVGRARAKELCLTGAMITAEEAFNMGLVNKVFPPETLMEETRKVASLIASKGKVAIRTIKHVIDRGMDVDLYSACALEMDGFALCFASADAKEGTSAFLEKRKPDFVGTLTG